jgi:hypothetical protein
MDNLDSKRKDLEAYRAIIYSNSGFTAPALRKAARVGIETASALKAGDQRIKVMIERPLIAKALSVDSMRIKLYSPPGQALEVEHRWQIDQLLCDGLPVINWISELSLGLIKEHEDAKQITFRCVFRPHEGWSLNNQILSVSGCELFFACSKKWVAQTVRVDVTLGLFDYLRRTVMIPHKQTYWMGWIDNEAWIEVDKEWEEKELAPKSFELYLTLYNPIHPINDRVAPKIEELIVEQEVQAE